MAFPIAVAGLIALVGFLAGCREDPLNEPKKSEKGDPPQDKGLESKVPRDAIVYPLTIDKKELQVHHQDKNQDGLFQPESEALFLKVDDRYIDDKSPEFENYRTRFHLPSFNGLRLASWHKVHQATFSTGATSSEEKELTDLQSFCRERGVDFLEASDRAARIQTKTGREKLDALTLVSFLLSVQKEGPGKLYESKNLKGKQENKDFIDTVLAKIQEGKLSLKDARGEKNKEYGLSAGGYMAYLPKENRLEISHELDLSHLSNKSSILHEMFHFYQDIQKRQMPALKSEEQAYLKEGEYAFYEEGLTKQSRSPEALEKIIDREFTENVRARELPTAQAFRVVYSQETENKALLKESLKNFRDCISLYYYLGPELLVDPASPSSKMVEIQVAEKLKMALRRTGFKSDDPQISQLVKKDLEKTSIPDLEGAIKLSEKELKHALKAYKEDKKDPAQLKLKLDEYYLLWFARNDLKRLIQSIKPDSPLLQAVEAFNKSDKSISCADPEIKEMFQAFDFPYPLDDLVSKFDGVE